KFTVQDLPGQPEYECAGFYGFTCGNGRAPMPKWRHKLRTTWSAPMDVDVALTWRYIASVDADSTSSNPVLSAATANVDRELGSRSYFDIAASWAATNWLTVRLGVNNIFDKDPPITALTDPSNFGNGNTFPQTYDTLGRRVFAGLTAKF
ncbi:MAG TPA: hypothetical protein VFR30_00750, partial [Lysobacter sp.]|nr:hypothetical protein [Lysobacter sp.]